MNNPQHTYKGKPVQLKLPELDVQGTPNYELYIDGEWEDAAYNLDTAVTIVHWYMDELIGDKAFFYPTHEAIEHEIDLIKDCFGPRTLK